jgi:hypothetical protein
MPLILNVPSHKIKTWAIDKKGIKIWVILKYSDETSWVPVAHAYNPTYSGGTYQEDHSSKPAWPNSSWDPISKEPSQK